MKIAIIGYGVEGQAAYKYWRDGNEITICDQKTTLQAPADAATQLGDDYLADLERFDIIVRSPFVRPDTLLAASSVDILPKITSNTNELLRVCPSRNIIGITGTKGKGTTSTLVAKMLEAAGKRVHLGGNIGVAPLELLQADISPDDCVVLELSSFQLIDLRQSPHIAACLMVVPEHLDWHTDVEEYWAAKQQLFRRQTPDDIAIYYSANERSTAIASAGQAVKIPYLQAQGAEVIDNVVTIAGNAICNLNEVQLLGKHNWQNICAAVTIAWQITQDINAMHQVITSFKGLPFRIELRGEVAGIKYYNDSYATGPGSCMAAINAISGPKVMILGGYDRGLDLTELTANIGANRSSIRAMLLIGDSKDRLAKELSAAGVQSFTISNASTMPEIVRQATDLAQPGDSVVLSPGFASFGLFENFEDRGRKFNAAVGEL